MLRASALSARPALRTEKEVRKELKTVEKSIAGLDAQKRTLTARFLDSTDDAVSKRLDAELLAVTGQLTEAEDRWSQLQEEIEAVV